MCFKGSKWEKVKNLDPASIQWYQGDDKLVGTTAMGDSSDQDQQWQKEFKFKLYS